MLSSWSFSLLFSFITQSICPFISPLRVWPSIWCNNQLVKYIGAPRTLCYPYSQPNAMEKLDGKIKRIYCLEVGGVGLCKTLKRNVHVPAISFGVSRHHVSRVQHIRYVFYCVCCLYVHAFRRLFCSLRFSPAGWLILAFRKRCQFPAQRARKTDKKNGRFHYFSTL